MAMFSKSISGLGISASASVFIDRASNGNVSWVSNLTDNTCVLTCNKCSGTFVVHIDMHYITESLSRFLEKHKHDPDEVKPFVEVTKGKLYPWVEEEYGE